jgi:cytochrome P450
MGKQIPAGTQIGVSVFGKMYSTTTFGADAAVFRPERWLEFGEEDGERERERMMRGVVEEVFSNGKWTCPGNGVARVELNKVFVEVSERLFFERSGDAHGAANKDERMRLM